MRQYSYFGKKTNNSWGKKRGKWEKRGGKEERCENEEKERK